MPINLNDTPHQVMDITGNSLQAAGFYLNKFSSNPSLDTLLKIQEVFEQATIKLQMLSRVEMDKLMNGLRDLDSGC